MAESSLGRGVADGSPGYERDLPRKEGVYWPSKLSQADWKFFSGMEFHREMEVMASVASGTGLGAFRGFP